VLVFYNRSIFEPRSVCPPAAAPEKPKLARPATGPAKRKLGFNELTGRGIGAALEQSAFHEMPVLEGRPEEKQFVVTRLQVSMTKGSSSR
jgi:hypothetical protein